VSVALAVDLGTSRLKAGLVDRTGRLLALAAVAAPPGNRHGACHEIDPEGWWTGLQSLAESLAGQCPTDFAAVGVLAVCGATRTQVLVGSDGRHVGPAIGWADTRAAAVSETLAATLPADAAERRHVNAYHPLARLSWLARHAPERLAHSATVLEPKDALVARLSGVRVSDAISQARLLAADAAELIDRSSCPRGVLPMLLPPEAIAGPVRPGLGGALGRLAGVPIVTGCHDTWTAVLGMGALRLGAAYNIVGTSEVLGLLHENPVAADGLLTVDWGYGLHQIGGPSQTGLDTLAWAESLLPAATAGSAADAAASDAPPLFLPFLDGERTPFWDPSLSGAFIGLRRSHGRRELLGAVRDGIALLNRLVLDRAEAAAGYRAVRIHLAGSGPAIMPLAQAKADALERPVAIAAPEPGLIGGAMLGHVALGAHASLADAMTVMARPQSVLAPDDAGIARLARLRPIFEDAIRILTPIAHGLAHPSL
jgi:xylulokinase